MTESGERRFRRNQLSGFPLFRRVSQKINRKSSEGYDLPLGRNLKACLRLIPMMLACTHASKLSLLNSDVSNATSTSGQATRYWKEPTDSSRSWPWRWIALRTKDVLMAVEVTLAEAILTVWLGCSSSPSLYLQNLYQWDPQILEYTGCHRITLWQWTWWSLRATSPCAVLLLMCDAIRRAPRRPYWTMMLLFHGLSSRHFILNLVATSPPHHYFWYAATRELDGYKLILGDRAQTLW